MIANGWISFAFRMPSSALNAPATQYPSSSRSCFKRINTLGSSSIVSRTFFHRDSSKPREASQFLPAHLDPSSLREGHRKGGAFSHDTGTSIGPPRRWVNFLVMESPSPVPPCRRYLSRRPVETVKYVNKRIRRNPNSCVETAILSELFASVADSFTSSFFGELDRIAEKIDDHLLQLVLITQNLGQAVGHHF